jgi:putative DNA primase/helicase
MEALVIRVADQPDFKALCEQACIALWGKPDKRDRKDLRWNGHDAYSAKTFSLKKQMWYDHGQQRGGGLLDLVAYSKGKPKQKLGGQAYFDAWREAHYMGLVPDPPPEKKPNGGGGPIIATYPYHDESGALLFEVVRFDASDPNDRFRQRRPDGSGGWIWNLKGVRSRLLYRLPALIAAVKVGQRVLITEGERDADTAVLLGLAATTMPGGVNKWFAPYDEFFRDADIVIVSDNDPQAKDPKTGGLQVHPDGRPVHVGQDHAAKLAKRLCKVAKHVRMIIFSQKDLTEWSEVGGNRAALEALIEAEPDLVKQLERDEDRRSPEEGDGAGFEDAVALQFAAVHEQDYRYVAQTGKWMIWRKTRWQAENTLKAFDAARALCRNGGDADAKVVTAVEKLARADRRIAATVEQWDADPNVLCTPGGVVDLRTGEMRTARREDYCSKQTAVAPAPPIKDGGPPPDLWLAFLDRVLNRNSELIAFIQRFLGYDLTGEVTEHVFAFLFGTGRNGKGVFARTAIGVLGDYACTSPIEMFLACNQDRHPTELARLRKVRLTVTQETPKGRAWDEAKIKNMTGGDPITARFMRQDFFDFDPTHKLLIAGNHKPSLRIVDEAIRSRLLLIPFIVTIPVEERDPELTEKLKPEYPAILRWMIEGCLKWRKHGLDVPKIVRGASDDYFHEQDVFAHWLDDCTERRQMARTASGDLFRSWKAWCEERGADVGSPKAFTKALQERGWSFKRTMKGGVFKDLVLKSKPDGEADEDGA